MYGDNNSGIPFTVGLGFNYDNLLIAVDFIKFVEVNWQTLTCA